MQDDADHAHQASQKEKARADTLASDIEKLLTRITGLEGVIRGLRDERALWSRELAAQGVCIEHFY